MKIVVNPNMNYESTPKENQEYIIDAQGVQGRYWCFSIEDQLCWSGEKGNFTVCEGDKFDEI